MKIRDYRYIKMWMEESDQNILFCIYPEKLEININIAKEIVKNRLEFCGGKSVYIIIDVTNVKSLTKEARDYMSSPDGGLKGILGGAFLSNNVVATLIINLFLKIKQPPVPGKFFTNREEALKWLKIIKTESKKNKVLETV